LGFRKCTAAVFLAEATSKLRLMLPLRAENSLGAKPLLFFAIRARVIFSLKNIADDFLVFK